MVLPIFRLKSMFSFFPYFQNPYEHNFLEILYLSPVEDMLKLRKLLRL